ncbi:hypothetical protein [Campylobacter sp. RM12651]|uniref:hypothetical protein n=1 Tax=Campylobacter sp. RM12651 TaxID=1660079 RepID=UPI001EFB83F0|nr:hypothetical protein [Campylobacter sp. RM12651]ULO03755.1 hypothetical protein AVBRAN_1301 [Campylobacter sp. RM12651]
MGLIDSISFLWANNGSFLVLLFYGALFLIIVFIAFSLISTEPAFLVFSLLSSLAAFLFSLLITKEANLIIEKQEKEKQEQIEKNKQLEISKMCFKLDTSIESDLKKDELQEKPIYALYELSNNYYFDLEKMQNAYYEKNQNSNGFSDNKELIKKYSFGYKNLLEIQKEIGTRRVYCFKNYCGDIYYKSELDNIDSMLKYYIKLKCKKEL